MKIRSNQPTVGCQGHGKANPVPYVGVYFEFEHVGDKEPTNSRLEAMRVAAQIEAARAGIPEGSHAYAGVPVPDENGEPTEWRRAGYRYYGWDLFTAQRGASEREARDLWYAGERPDGWPQVWHDLVDSTDFSGLPEGMVPDIFDGTTDG